MIFTQTKLKGAYIIDIEKLEDDRGFFARTWCEDQFAAHDIDMRISQGSVSFSPKQGTLRGLHYQDQPCEEAKLIRCTRGEVFCVLIDLRADSNTYTQHITINLTQDNHRSVFVPPMVANGFQTLLNDSEVSYQMSEKFNPKYMRGVRWNDPLFAIQWPLEVSSILARDNQFPDFSPDGDRTTG